MTIKRTNEVKSGGEPVLRGASRGRAAGGRSDDAAGGVSGGAARLSAEPFSTDSGVEAFRHFLPLAEALPADEVPIFRGEVALARTNIERGVDAIAPHVERIARALPEVSVTELLELPALALALIHADGRVAQARAGEIDAALGEVSELRALTLRYLEVAGGLGLVPAERVRAIRAGRGKLDVARDCVDIAGVFVEHEADLAGKHPFTAEQLDELSVTGTWLVQAITPRGAARQPPARHPAALVRDRFWKLVIDRHDDLRTAGVVVFGIRRVDEHVPALQSRVGSVRAAAGEPEPGGGEPSGCEPVPEPAPAPAPPGCDPDDPNA